MARLIQKLADGSLGREWPLSDKPLRFGRGQKADAMVADSEMSREHFEIEPRKGAYVIKDLHSKNGTWVNGGSVTERLLLADDQIRAGSTTFVYVVDKPKGLRTVIREIEQESKQSGKGLSTLRREVYKKL